MEHMTWKSLFGSPTGKRRPHLHRSKAIPHTLPADTTFNGYTYAKGSVYTFFETQNFGWVVFQLGSKTPEGHIPGRLIHKF